MKIQSIVTSGQGQRGRQAIRWIGLGFVGLAVAVYDAPVAKSQAEDWQGIIAAAKREGTIGVVGSGGEGNRKALTTAFERRYPDIKVEFLAGRSSQVVQKVIIEQSAGKYLHDIAVLGTNSNLQHLRPAKASVPIRPYLVGPDIEEKTKWRGGELMFLDTAKTHAIAFVTIVGGMFPYNPDLVSPSEFKSWRDLLDPKWKGKIEMRDPLVVGGSGKAFFVHWYSAPGLGKEFVTEFLNSGVVTFLKSDRQLVEWVARGRYTMGLGVGLSRYWPLKRKGVNIDLVDPHGFKESGYLSVSNGVISTLRRAPHPNATKVYLNWFFSKEGQTIWAQEMNHISRRTDVPTDHLPKGFFPREGVKYNDTNSGEKSFPLQNEVRAYVKSVLRR